MRTGYNIVVLSFHASSGCPNVANVDAQADLAEADGAWLFSACSSLLLPLSGARPLMDPLFIVPVSPLIATHFKQHSLAFQCTAGCGVNARLSPKSGKYPYLDAKWCAALEKLLYVVQALAVVFRFLVDLQRRKRRLGIQFQFTLRVPRCSHCGLLSSSALKMNLLDRHAFYSPQWAWHTPGGWTRIVQRGSGGGWRIGSREVTSANRNRRWCWILRLHGFFIITQTTYFNKEPKKKKRLKLIYPHWF